MAAIANQPGQGQGQPANPQQQQAPAPAPAPAPASQLSTQVQQQLNLEDVRQRAIDLSNALSRIIHHIETNPNVKWNDLLSQYSVVNASMLNAVDDIKKVSKAFVVYPKTANPENSMKLPVMLSTKLLPEMESEETTLKDQILAGISNHPVPVQIEKLKNRIDAINTACVCAEKTINDTRKLYGLSSRYTAGNITNLDKVQAAKIEEQEKILRASVNFGEGLRLPHDQRVEPSILPPHLEHAIASSDVDTIPVETMGTGQSRSLQSFPIANSASQSIARSPMLGTGGISMDNTTASPMQFANSPRSAANIMNVPSPQQQQRPKLSHLTQQTQAYQSQQLRPQSAHLNMQPHISQEQQNQLHVKHQQERQAYHNFANRQFLPGSTPQGLGQNSNLQGLQPKHQMSSGNPGNIYGGNQNFLPSQTYNNVSMYSRNISSQGMFSETGFNVGGSQTSTSPIPSQQHSGSNFAPFPNVQFGGQSNLPNISNVPLGSTTSFTSLPNHTSNFNNIQNFSQTPLHAQNNYGNVGNPIQNPNTSHPRQQPPQ